MPLCIALTWIKYGTNDYACWLLHFLPYFPCFISVVGEEKVPSLWPLVPGDKLCPNFFSEVDVYEVLATVWGPEVMKSIKVGRDRWPDEMKTRVLGAEKLLNIV